MDAHSRELERNNVFGLVGYFHTSDEKCKGRSEAGKNNCGLEQEFQHWEVPFPVYPLTLSATHLPIRNQVRHVLTIRVNSRSFAAWLCSWTALLDQVLRQLAVRRGEGTQMQGFVLEPDLEMSVGHPAAQLNRKLPEILWSA